VNVGTVVCQLYFWIPRWSRFLDPWSSSVIHTEYFGSEYTMGAPGMCLHPHPLSEERVRN